MPLIQGGPPEWIWERTPNLLKWDLVRLESSNGHPAFELRVSCGLEIVRLHACTQEEIHELRGIIDEALGGRPCDPQPERTEPGRELAAAPHQAPGTNHDMAEAERGQTRPEGVVSDPDRPSKR